METVLHCGGLSPGIDGEYTLNRVSVKHSEHLVHVRQRAYAQGGRRSAPGHSGLFEQVRDALVKAYQKLSLYVIFPELGYPAWLGALLGNRISCGAGADYHKRCRE